MVHWRLIAIGAFPRFSISYSTTLSFPGTIAILSGAWTVLTAKTGSTSMLTVVVAIGMFSVRLITLIETL